MNYQLPMNTVSRSKGVSLIEILLVLGLLALLLSFAMPSVGGAVNKAEMKSTFENIQYSLQVARKTARMTESAVSMNISLPGPETAQAITFSTPIEGNAHRNLQIQDFKLPADVLLISDHESFIFDERGLVRQPGRILLVSRNDESVTSTINVE